jgi:hypothetical protein
MTEAFTGIVSRVTRRSALAASDRDAMFALLSRHFDGVRRDQFERDLQEKNWVILLEGESGLAGFTTLLAYETRFAGAPVSVIFSGDTIVAGEARGSTALARAWIDTVHRLRLAYSQGPYYWLLLTSGYRTYRFLPVFWREFHPRFDAAMPAAGRDLLDHLAGERFGTQYNPATGVVRFTQPQRLRGKLAWVPDGRAADPHVAFFLSRNPGHAEGDELVCLTALDDENLTRAGRRMIEPPTA